ncbi:MAG: trigger factor [Deltaproteobacteria bacterium]|nr:trigger factor [Deltaproteobacteria bacterium]
MDNAAGNFVIEDETPVKKRVNLKLDDERTNELLKKKLEVAAKRSNIKGFRPGKAPLSVIKKFYEAELLEEAAGEILNEDFKKILAEKELFVVGTPKVERRNGKEYTIHFEVMPSLKNLNLDLKIKEVKKRPITGEVIEDEINFLLERIADSEKIDDFVVINNNDRYFIKIDYITLDEEGKEVDNAKDYLISLNSNIIDKSFEAVFIGKKKGDNFEYNDKERNVTVKGVIKGMDKKILPELNAETVKNFGDFKGIDEFREYVKKNLEEYEDKRYKEAVRSQVADELVKLNPLPLPQSIVEEDALARLEDLKKQGKYKDADEKQKGDLMNMLKLMAERDLALYHLLSEISKTEDIKVAPGDFEEFYKKTAKESGLKEDDVKGFYASEEAGNNLKQALLEDKIFDFLVANKVSYL